MATVVASCNESPTQKTPMTQGFAPSSEQLAQLRGEVLAQLKPFAGRAEYAVTDPDIVDPCIADRLRGLGDRMPTASERADFVRNAVISVENALRQPDGLARVAKRIAERYEHPAITRDGDQVTIDVGIVAGKLHIAGGQIEVFDTDSIDMGQWSTPEVVRFLKMGITRFPGAQTYTAHIEIPRRATAPEWSYVYDRGEDRIRVYGRSQPGVVYVTGRLGGDVGAVKSLRMTELRQEKADPPPSWR